MHYVNFFVKSLNFASKWSIAYFQSILAAIYVTTATVKVKVIWYFYTLVILLINLKEQIGEKQYLYFSLLGGGGGGAKKPLNACSSLKLNTCIERQFGVWKFKSKYGASSAYFLWFPNKQQLLFYEFCTLTVCYAYCCLAFLCCLSVVCLVAMSSLKVCNLTLVFLFSMKTYVCRYSKELYQWDGCYEHPKHALKLMNKKIFHKMLKTLFIQTYACCI